MNSKSIIDNWIAFITGTSGGVTALQIEWHQEWIKLAFAGTTALVMGAMGVAGKYAMVWAWKKTKSIFNHDK